MKVQTSRDNGRQVSTTNADVFSQAPQKGGCCGFCAGYAGCADYPNCKGGEFQGSKEEQKGYVRIIEQTYKPADERKNVKEYKYIRDLSTFETSVYVDEKAKLLVMCYRGSVTREDWIISDGLIALAPFAFQKSDRFQRSLKETEAAVKRFKGYRLMLVGHSLGGFIASNMWQIYTKRDPRTRFVIFNRGSSPVEIFSRRPVDFDHRDHYYVPGDWISKPFLRDPKTEHHEVKQRLDNPHGWANFV